MDKHVTFIIPVRIDSTQRRENLLAVVESLRENLKSKIILMKGDKESAFTNNEKSNFANKEVDDHFIRDKNSLFHRTKYLNPDYALG